MKFLSNKIKLKLLIIYLFIKNIIINYLNYIYNKINEISISD